MKTLSILALFLDNERGGADLTKRPAPPQRQPEDIAMCDEAVEWLIVRQIEKQGEKHVSQTH